MTGFFHVRDKDVLNDDVKRTTIANFSRVQAPYLSLYILAQKRKLIWTDLYCNHS